MEANYDQITMMQQLSHLPVDQEPDYLDSLLSRHQYYCEALISVHALDMNNQSDIGDLEELIFPRDFQSLFPTATEEELGSFMPEIFPTTINEADTTDGLIDSLSNFADGVLEEIIKDHLKLRTCEDEDLQELCVVCQNEYKYEEMLATLDCGHVYHGNCIQRWLLEKNFCPLCKQRGIQQLELYVN